MIKKVLVFEVGGIRITSPKLYKKEPTKEQVHKDIQEWFFENQSHLFAVKEDGVETNFKDWLG